MLGKRDRLHDIVEEALQEDEQRKQGKSKAREKRVTINESLNVEHKIERVVEEDDGPIKEHLVDMAHQQRQSTREAQRLELLDKFESGPDVEVAQDIAELDGHTLEAFNMNDERERGFIDAEGAYVERKDKEEEELAKDAWLASIEVVSDEVKAKIKQREDAAAGSAALSDEDLAKARRAMIALMQPRETVMQALQRISQRPKDPKGLKPKPRVGRQEEAPEAQQRRATIETFTEAASTIMAFGETDIYDQRKEELEHACTLLPSAGATALAGMLTDDPGVEDMFADSDNEEQAAVSIHSIPAAAAEQAAGDPSSSAPALPLEEAASGTPAQSSALANYDDWPISELRRVLTEAKVDISGVVEKSELITKVHELDQQQAAAQVPPGFVLDASSGYYYQLETNMYWDVRSGYYCKDRKWLILDPITHQYKEAVA